MKGPVIYYPIAEMFGTDIGGVKSAKEFRESILEDIDAGLKVELDFQDVRTVGSAWIRNCLGKIVTDKGNEFFIDNIRVINHEKIRKQLLKVIGEYIEYVESYNN